MPSEAIQSLSALLTPTVAIAGEVIGTLNYLHARRKRMDDLFDRRYAFYARLREIWLSTGNGAGPDEDPSVSIPIAEEAQFLFGEDIEKHILSLDKKGHRGYPDFPNSDFVEPFERYLRL